MAYGIAYLYRHSSQIARDPTLHSAPFIYANQAAIAVSLWCRVLEAARKLQQDMGYASYGHGSDMGSYGANSKLRPSGYAARSKQSRSLHASRQKESRAEDEIELRPAERTTRHTANVEGGTLKQDQSWLGGIEVSREYGYIEHDRASEPSAL